MMSTLPDGHASFSHLPPTIIHFLVNWMVFEPMTLSYETSSPNVSNEVSEKKVIFILTYLLSISNAFNLRIEQYV